MFDIRLNRENAEEEPASKEVNLLVTPGCVVSSDPGFMRGHGTWIDEDEKICATVTGTVERINKLYSVRAQRSRYNGEVGDVVVGRIVEVQHKRWLVDVNARLNAILLLSSVNLPGGELRRKTEEDELMMRHHLEVGDLISAEVQSLFSDGSLSLHTRSLKYGKLSQGQLVKVPSYLIQRTKTHFHNIISGIQLILSNNGYIWMFPTTGEDVETGGFVQNLECISTTDRENIARLKNCILSLTAYNKQLNDTIILYAYQASMIYQTKQLLKSDIMKDVVDSVMQRMEFEGQ
ncbi:exosome complex component RRP4 [Trichonephila inaurata madagascariensis]|uniref:Exosome complex component RRP4 n=1 Tax=Trichonephila inaurata madagascariensis TaxID=2747483 RepID=A0A8X6WMM7_9ARAC|nr:exosome complex component RRP4 [Trichonephila inaurata madagascariensis]